MSGSITIIGNIGGEITHLYTKTGVPITRFRVACSQRRFDRATESWIDGETSWFSVSTYRGLAVNAHASFRKGDRVVVHGRLRVRDWESGERRGVNVEIDAEAAGHDLLWGSTGFTPTGTVRTVPVGAGDPTDGEAGERAPVLEDAGEPAARPLAPSGWYEPMVGAQTQPDSEFVTHAGVEPAF